MRQSRWPTVVRKLLAEVPDQDLLERYVQNKDDDAFAQLVTRYSRLVWGQCRNLLHGDADADDAFQATFLALARGAKTIRTGAPLGPWLHGTAYRVCQNARRADGRRMKRERAKAQPEANRPVADSTWEEAFTAVAEEVQKLPMAQRTAFVLCCIEGRTANDAAKTLGQKTGTFSARLSRAKQTLLDRLAKRGLGAGVLALGGVTGSVAFAPAAVIENTLALLSTGTIIPSSIQTLLNGVHGMSMLKIKLLAAAVLVASGLGLSLGNGWFGSAQAQVGAPPATAKKGDAEIDKLKADLEKAKKLLAEAEERERTAKDEVEKSALKSHIDRQRDLARAAQLEAVARYEQQKPLPIKFEYEAVPKEGFGAKDFEAKLASREKNGWEFLGQVTMNRDDNLPKEQKGTVPPAQHLVFRKKPKQEVAWLGENMNLDWAYHYDAPTYSGYAARKAVDPANPYGPIAPAAPKLADPNGPKAPPAPPMPKVADPLAPVGPKTPPIAVEPKPAANPNPVANPLTPPPPKPVAKELPEPRVRYPGDLPDDVRNKLVQAELDRHHIAALEKELKELKEKMLGFPMPVEVPAKKKQLFTKEQYGSWKPGELQTVLLILLQADRKLTADDITMTVEPNGISIESTPENIDAVAEWIKKLKK